MRAYAVASALLGVLLASVLTSAPAAAGSPAMGTLEIIAEPFRDAHLTDANAEWKVVVDGARRGILPLQIGVSAGSHEVTLESTASKRQFTVLVEAGKTSRVTLSRTGKITGAAGDTRAAAKAAASPSPIRTPTEAERKQEEAERKEEQACVAAGGTWRAQSMLVGKKICDRPMADGGKDCKDGTDCSAGVCYAASSDATSGTCARSSTTVGRCYSQGPYFLRGGKAQPMPCTD